MALILLNINVEVRKNFQSDFRPTTTEKKDQFKVFLTGKSLHKTEDVVSLKRKNEAWCCIMGRKNISPLIKDPPTWAHLDPLDLKDR